MRDRNIPACAALVLLALTIFAPTDRVQAQMTATAGGTWQPLWIAVELNGIEQPQTIIARDADGQLWAPWDALDAWRIARLDAMTPHEFLGRPYYALREIAGGDGLQWHIDQRRQVLVLTASPAVLRETVISDQRGPVGDVMQLPPGGFLNYDLSVARFDKELWHSGFVESAFFRGPLLATQTLAAIDASDSVAVRRLDSTVSIDFPETRATLVLGDAISIPGQWGRPVRYAGVQWATNFETRPDLLTFPLPTLSGDVAVPSTIDVFIDGALRASRAVPPGPFTITELPAIAGNGQITARVRDMFGHEREISQTFYATPQLLRPGLVAYALEAGMQRQAYGRDDDNYAEPFAQAAWKRGMSETTTAELRGEALLDQASLGASVIRRIANLGVLQGALVGSHGESGEGALAQVGFDYAGRTFGFGGQASVASTHFRQIGALDANHRGVEMMGRMGYHVRRLGSFAAAYVRRTDRDGRALDLATASYAREMGQWGFFSLTLVQDLGSNAEPSVFASITQLLGGTRSAQYMAHRDEHGTRMRMELRKNRVAGPGVGYEVAAERGVQDAFSGEAAWQGGAGAISGEIAHRAGTTGARATVSGAVGVLGGDLYAMPRIDGNFAVVEVPALADVPVYLENQPVGHTDARGRTAITGLRPYEINRISIDPVDLPLTANLASDKVEAIPYGRGGVLVRMPIQLTRGLLIRLLRDAVDPVPVGARLTFGGRQYPVATDGNVYIEDAERGGVAQVRWQGGECEAMIDVELPSAGTGAVDVVCRSSRWLRTGLGSAP